MECIFVFFLLNILLLFGSLKFVELEFILLLVLEGEKFLRFRVSCGVEILVVFLKVIFFFRIDFDIEFNVVKSCFIIDLF